MSYDVFGLKIGDLPDGFQPVNVVVIVESVDLSDPTGTASMRRLSILANDECPLWTAAGMLRLSLADMETQFLEKFEQ